jgi:two-component system sensor histidine kinase HupT/HoxJ
MPREHPPLPTPAHDTPPEGVGEDVWIDVIRKMDEVYSDLLQYEVALEEKNAALEETQKFLFSVLTSMSDILVVCDRHGAIQEVNQALAELSGRGEGELRGAPLASLFADEASRGFMARLLAAPGAGERQHDRELLLATRGGGSTPVAMNCTPRLSPVGKLAGLVLTGRPVGELRRAYDALRQAHEDLKQAQHQLVHSEKMASLGRLVAGVAHELNNPISFVLGNVYALQRYGSACASTSTPFTAANPEELAGLRKRLRIDRLMEDMQPLHRRHASRAPSAPATSSPACALLGRRPRREHRLRPGRGARALGALGGEGLRLTHQGRALRADHRAAVSGSPGQMQQVLVNLVQNAIDSTEPAGAQARLDIDATCAARRSAWSPSATTARASPEALSAGVRSVLHHQAGGQGHRAGPVDQLRHRRAPRRPPRGRQRRGRRRHAHPDAAAGRGKWIDITSALKNAK